MSDITKEMGAAAAHSVPQHRIWPQAIVGIGLGVTGAWICVLVNGFGRLLGLLLK